MAAPESLKQMVISAGLLAGFAVAGSLLLGVTESGTREHIQANERAFLINSLNQVLPPTHYDNDLLHDTRELIAAEAFGTDAPVTVYRARHQGRPVAALFTVIAPDGYSGDIKLLIGANWDGTLSGVRAVAHRETPGLGDAVEVDRSNWILGFSGLSLSEPEPDRWRVKKDGGDFDQFTGATITPRAVVKAVKKALLYFNAHREAFFTAVVSEEEISQSPSSTQRKQVVIASAAKQSPNTKPPSRDRRVGFDSSR